MKPAAAATGRLNLKLSKQRLGPYATEGSHPKGMGAPRGEPSMCAKHVCQACVLSMCAKHVS